MATLVCREVRDKESERSGVQEKRNRQEDLQDKTGGKKEETGCGRCNIQTEQLKQTMKENKLSEETRPPLLTL